MILTTVCKLYPSRSDEKKLNHLLIRATEVYNYYAPLMGIAAYRGESYSAYSWKKVLTEDKRSIHSEWNDTNRSILNNVIFKIQDSIKTTKSKYRKAKYVKSEKKKRVLQNAKFSKAKKSGELLNWIKLDNGYEIKDNYLELGEYGGRGKRKVLASIQFRGGREIPNSRRVDEITIKKKNSEWFLYLSYEIQEPEIKEQSNPVGIDWGIGTFLTFSDKSHIEIPEFRTKREEKLYKDLQNRLRQQKRGSHRYEKTLIRLSNVKQKEKRRKIDYYFKLCLDIVRKYNTVCIEDLNLTNLKSKRLRHGRSMDRQSSSIFFATLQWMCRRQGVTFVTVNPRNTSKTCNNCGYINENLKISDRSWNCPECNSSLDRDLNAAKNILLLGLYTLRIRGSAREVENSKVWFPKPTIQDCFQVIGIKREVNQLLDIERS